MPITPTENIVIPPTTEKVADKYWLQSLNINAPSLTDRVDVIARLVPYSSTTGEMFFDKSVTVIIDDVLTKAASDMQLAQTCEAIFSEIDRQAKLQNLI